jgi:hypothetical protein
MVVDGYTVQLVYNDHSREPAIYGLYEQLSFTYRQKTKRLNKTNPIKDQEWIHVLHNDKQWSTEHNTENQKNEQDEPHQRPGMNSCAPQWQTILAPLVALVVLHTQLYVMNEKRSYINHRTDWYYPKQILT